MLFMIESRTSRPLTDADFPGMGLNRASEVFSKAQACIAAGDVDGLAVVLTSAMVESAVEEVSSLRPAGSESTSIVPTKSSSA